MFELFDPKADLSISEHFRPHWSQAGAIVFITFRTADSIPQEVLDRWEREKHDWMRRHNCPIDRHWSEVLPTLDPPIRDQFKKEFNSKATSMMQEHDQHQKDISALKLLEQKEKQFHENINLINDMRRVVLHRYCNK